MKLNKKKCMHIDANISAKIKFLDGSILKKANEAVYLGAKINKTADPKGEVNNRIQMTTATLKKLNKFFSKAPCSKVWKIKVFNAVLVSKLLYGLETIPISEASRSRIDAFQMKGLRKILGIDHPFFSRVSNKTVFEMANDGLKTQIAPLSATLAKRRLALLGHLIREEEGSPTKIALIDDQGKIAGPTYKRIGRPRVQWLEQSLTEAFKQLFPEDDYDHKNDLHRAFIINAAKARHF